MVKIKQELGEQDAAAFELHLTLKFVLLPCPCQFRCSSYQDGPPSHVCFAAVGTPTNKRQQGAAAPGLHQDASRHRYRFAPPATPEGLWDMDFPDSQALAKPR